MQTFKKSDKANSGKSRLRLLPPVHSVSAAQVLEVSSTQRIYACDFAIAGAENFLESSGGTEPGGSDIPPNDYVTAMTTNILRELT